MMGAVIWAATQAGTKKHATNAARATTLVEIRRREGRAWRCK
jgi:hypothetical protein